MIHRTVTIDGLVWAIPNRLLFRELQTAVLTAVRAGGGMVRLPTRGNEKSATVLVTPHQTFVFMEREVPDPDPTDDALHPDSYLDMEL